MKSRVAVVVGTRPEAIKLGPVVASLRQSRMFEPLLVSTGQHRQMLEQALDVFDLTPEVDLRVMAPGQTLHDVTSKTVLGMRGVLAEHTPAWVIVQGDTTTAFAAGLAAFYEKVPVAHVEAGLRSGERYAPFPEELNRRLVDQIAELLFAPTESAASALRSEGVPAERVYVTGNTVVDALLAARQVVRARSLAPGGLAEAAVAGRRIVLVTAHRRESFGDAFRSICIALRRIVRENQDVCVVYPVHMNPNIDGPARALLGGEERIVLVPPMPYLDFVALLERSHLVLTDSGGVQEEAPTFGKPLLVLREVTERPEGISAGVAKLVGTSADRIASEANALLADPAQYRAMANATNPYGDGCAALRIVDILEQYAALARPGVRPAA